MIGEAEDMAESSPLANSDQSDSRKRPRDTTETETVIIKRPHPSSGNDGVYHLKILVPSVAAGAIIGKGGETIAQLQKDTNARVKMSKANDFYPGTSERVCLISGNIEAIMEVLDFINTKIREKPEGAKPGSDYDPKGEREKQVKILVPNSTAGMIIGKGGNYIKQLKEESGAYVQISQKAKDQTLQERCITVMGDNESNKRACSLILSKVQEDPQSGNSLNVSYADFNGPVANFNPTGSPYAQSVPAIPSINTTIPGNHQVLFTPELTDAASLNGISVNINLTPYRMHNASAHIINNILTALHNLGYSEQTSSEISNALLTLSKFGSLTANFNTSPLNNFMGLNHIDSTNTSNDNAQAVIKWDSTYGHVNTTTTRSILHLAVDSFLQNSSDCAVSPQLNNNTFTVNKQISASKDNKIEVEVPEILVGAILGPGGRSLIGIQHCSGTVIQISKKGVYAPGTRNRIVSINGSTINAVNTAKCLIEQRINEEKLKRQNMMLLQ